MCTIYNNFVKMNAPTFLRKEVRLHMYNLILVLFLMLLILIEQNRKKKK